MICSACDRAEAAVFLKTIINNSISQQALCAPCAAKAEGADSGTNLLLKLLASRRPRKRVTLPPCACGLRFADFKKSGRFGCPKCYTAFAAQVARFLPQIHNGKSRHLGKRPRKGHRPE